MYIPHVCIYIEREKISRKFNSFGFISIFLRCNPCSQIVDRNPWRKKAVRFTGSFNPILVCRLTVHRSAGRDTIYMASRPVFRRLSPSRKDLLMPERYTRIECCLSIKTHVSRMRANIISRSTRFFCSNNRSTRPDQTLSARTRVRERRAKRTHASPPPPPRRRGASKKKSIAAARYVAHCGNRVPREPIR